jgi:hypothetical protein
VMQRRASPTDIHYVIPAHDNSPAKVGRQGW